MQGILNPFCELFSVCVRFADRRIIHPGNRERPWVAKFTDRRRVWTGEPEGSGLAKAASAEETPMMRQYLAIKARVGEAILLYRMGDFYETFGQDAVDASRILGLTLTARGNGAAEKVPLAGFPHHQLERYLPRLVTAGRKVAVC